MTTSEDRAQSPRAPFVATAETHTGAVFFVGDLAYKMKKPVRFGFVDFTSLEARRSACQREVELNRRLSPDVYLGVADLVGPDRRTSEHLVVMRRLPAQRSLRALAGSGLPLDAELDALVERLVDFHAGAAEGPEIARSGTPEALASRWRRNAEGMAEALGRVFDRADHHRVGTLAERYIAGRAELFSRRIQAGHIRDGHGDLLADDVFCLDDGPRILDCLEFDDALRACDVLSDVASLAMDLAHRGRPDLADRLLAAYRSSTGDDWPPSLAHHYLAYRAQVRALVSGLRADQGEPSAAEEARSLIERCRRHLEAGRVRLVVVGGLPGSGKSTLARGAGAALGASVVRSDEVRKALAGLEPATPAPARFAHGLYSEASTEATYRELLARAGRLLGLGHSVVLDATFTDPRWRAAARRLAERAVADLDEVRCHAPLGVLQRRVAERAAQGGDASDATVEVTRRLAAAEVPWPEAATVETDGPPDGGLTRLRALLDVEVDAAG